MQRLHAVGPFVFHVWRWGQVSNTLSAAWSRFVKLETCCKGWCVDILESWPTTPRAAKANWSTPSSPSPKQYSTLPWIWNDLNRPKRFLVGFLTRFGWHCDRVSCFAKRFCIMQRMTEIWLLQQLQDKFTKIVNQDINMMILWVCRSHSFVVVSCISIWYVLTLTKARPPWPSSQPELNELRAEALNNALLSATALHVFFNDNECTKSPKSLGTSWH